MNYKKIKYFTFPFLINLLLLSGVFVLSNWYKAKNSKPAVVTFQVNMINELKRGRPIQSIGIRGNNKPFSWKKSIPLADTNGDGIYETTIRIEDIKGLQYKYVIENDEVEWEEDIENRSLLEAEKEQLIILNYWNTNK